MPVLRRIREEVSKVALATLYFFVSFSIVLTLKMLYLAEFEIEVAAITKAAVGALVVGKVVVVLGATSFGTRFRQRMVALDVAYRSLLYTNAVALVVIAEHVVHGYFETGTWAGGWAHTVEAASLTRMIANLLGIYLSFVGYNVLNSVATHFGRDRLLEFLFSRRGTAMTLPARSEPLAHD